MRFKYSTNSPNQNEFDSLPRIPIILHKNNLSIETNGLVDSGATVNVLPYQFGIQLGEVWDNNQPVIQLAGNLSNQLAIPVSAMVKIADFPSTRLVFAWTNSPNLPLILGQPNFFLEFDVCFYRSKLEFEFNPKS